MIFLIRVPATGRPLHSGGPQKLRQFVAVSGFDNKPLLGYTPVSHNTLPLVNMDAVRNSMATRHTPARDLVK